MQKGIIKNVNRITGESIDAKDLASLFSGIIGEESGVLTVFDELRLEKINDNKVRLHSGVYSLKGHILYISKGSYEDFEIDSGTLGANRIDLLVAEYVKNGEGDGEDTLQFRIVKGESSSGSPQSPDLIQQDINENGITRQEVLYELRLTGLNLSVQDKYKFIENINDLEDRVDEGIKNIGLTKKIKATIINSNYYEGSKIYNYCIINELAKTVELNIFMVRATGIAGHSWYTILQLPVKPEINIYFMGWIEGDTDSGVQVPAKLKIDTDGKLWCIVKDEYTNAHSIRGHIFFQYRIGEDKI